MFLYFFSSADSSLGKIDKHSLSQQTLMELFIEGITANKEKICGDLNEPKDISEWKGLNRNKANEIIDIYWLCLALEGSIEFRWLPMTTRKVVLGGNKLTGTADLRSLPDGLEFLSLSMNRFYGTIDLTCLPAGIQRIKLCQNNFTGKTDFGHLPKSLQYLDVSNTDLEGEIRDFGGTLDIEDSWVNDMRGQL